MPIIKSAIRDLRVSKRKRERNLEWKSKLSSSVKSAKKAIVAKESEAAKKVSQAYQVIDKTAKNRVISAQRAGRLKARLAKSLNEKELPKTKKSIENKASTKKKTTKSPKKK